VRRLTAWRRLNARLRAWLGRAREDRKFAEELDARVEMLVEEHVRHGLTPEAARRERRWRASVLVPRCSSSTARYAAFLEAPDDAIAAAVCEALLAWKIPRLK
jgi:hypothetical protein